MRQTGRVPGGAGNSTPARPQERAQVVLPDLAHDRVEMRHGLLEGRVVEDPALDRREGRRRGGDIVIEVQNGRPTTAAVVDISRVTLQRRRQ